MINGTKNCDDKSSNPTSNNVCFTRRFQNKHDRKHCLLSLTHGLGNKLKRVQRSDQTENLWSSY